MATHRAIPASCRKASRAVLHVQAAAGPAEPTHGRHATSPAGSRGAWPRASASPPDHEVADDVTEAASSATQRGMADPIACGGVWQSGCRNPAAQPSSSAPPPAGSAVRVGLGGAATPMQRSRVGPRQAARSRHQPTGVSGATGRPTVGAAIREALLQVAGGAGRGCGTWCRSAGWASTACSRRAARTPEAGRASLPRSCSRSVPQRRGAERNSARLRHPEQGRGFSLNTPRLDRGIASMLGWGAARINMQATARRRHGSLGPC